MEAGECLVQGERLLQSQQEVEYEGFKGGKSAEKDE